MNTLRWKHNWQAALAVAALAAALGAPVQACIPGGPVRCVPTGQLESGAVPLSRADIEALIKVPGPPVTRAVRRDTARIRETVRGQSLPYPGNPPQEKKKGDTP